MDSLIYAMLGTRIDLAYAMSLVSQHMSKAGSIYGTTIKRIMRYLKSTLYFKLYLRGNNIILYDYYNVDWVKDKNNRRSLMR